MTRQPSYSYDRVTSDIEDQIAHISDQVNKYVANGERETAANEAYTLWGAFRLWQRITSGDQRDGDAARLEDAIGDVIYAAS